MDDRETSIAYLAKIADLLERTWLDQLGQAMGQKVRTAHEELVQIEAREAGIMEDVRAIRTYCESLISGESPDDSSIGQKVKVLKR